MIAIGPTTLQELHSQSIAISGLEINFFHHKQNFAS